MIKSLLLFAFASVLCVFPVRAQEVVPLDEAQRGARKVTDALSNPADAPFTLAVDVTKPQAIKAGKAGLLVIPGKQLSAETLAGVGSDVTPIGQLWTVNVSLGKDGQAVANDQLRILRISEGDRDVDVQLYYLGAAKNAEGKLDLVVFAKGKEPLLKQSLTKTAETTPAQLLPIEMSGRKEDDATGVLSLRLLGGYSADLTVKRPAE